MIIDATIFYDLLKVIVHRNDEKIHKLADSLFSTYTDNFSSIGQNDIKYCELYIALCKEIISNQLNVESNKIDIINVFKRHLMNKVFQKDTYISDALKSVVDDELNPVRMSDIISRLNNIIMWYVSKQYITKLYGNLKESELSYSIERQSESLTNVRSLLDEFKASINNIDMVTNKNGPVESINMSDIASIREAYNLFKERRVNHVIKTGLQGLNQILGPDGGICLGESIVFAARTHNYKSGILTKVPQWIVQYNKPPKIMGRMPMILFISLENEGFQNMIKIFKEMYISIKGCPPPETMTEDEIVNEIYLYFNSNDYTFVIERYLPSYFGYSEYVTLIEKYESAGFKVITTIVDYLSQMKLTNFGSTSKSGDHSLLQTLYNNVCNFNKASGNSLITAHQLNRGASDIAASGIPYPVKRYSERHFADSSGIAREVDGIVYLEIEKDEEGNSWLTMQWGKRRYVEGLPDSHKFSAYKFDPILGIQDDINGEPMFSRNIYKKNKKEVASVSDIEAILGGL